MDTLHTIRSLAAAQFGGDADAIDVDAPVDQLGIDSLGFLEFLFELEDKFGALHATGVGQGRSGRFASSPTAVDALLVAPPSAARVGARDAARRRHGMGVVTPVGHSARDVLRRAASTDAPAIRPVPATLGAGDASSSPALVDFDATAHWPPHQAAQSRSRDAVRARRRAARRSPTPRSPLSEQESTERAGVYWGTGLGGATSIEESYRQLYAGSGRVRPTAVVLGMNNAAAGHISIANGLRGPLLNCLDGVLVVGVEHRRGVSRAIRDGYADVIVAGGSEALITNGNLRAWDAMQALAHADPRDPARSCKPFSANRTGIVLGEGAAALVLESADHAERRGARIYAELAGYGNAADASRHLAGPMPPARCARCAPRSPTRGVAAGDVGYINAHGTATSVGDVVETQRDQARVRHARRRVRRLVDQSAARTSHGRDRRGRDGRGDPAR